MQPDLESSLKAFAINTSEMRVFIRVFKKEEVMELWAANENQAFQLIQTYPFCVNSGMLGPKRKEGDRQIPEGCYVIDRFNPQSKFHLSLGINYPNDVDLVHANQAHPGSDIFIHGGCASIGCISITNQKIEEVYRLCEQAKTNGQQSIFVHLFPFRMTHNNLAEHSSSFPDHLVLWEQLTEIYDAFESTKQIPKVVSKEGSYVLLTAD